MKRIGIEHTTYVKDETTLDVTSEVSRINTEFFLDHSELPDMLAAARVMQLGAAHLWAQHAPEEAMFVVQACHLSPGNTLLDVGCGNGRHVLELATLGVM